MGVSSCRDNNVESTGTGARGVCTCVSESEAEFVVVRDERCYFCQGDDVEAPVARVESQDALGVHIFVDCFDGSDGDSWVVGDGRGRD